MIPIDIILAFIEGLALIVSPCILPVLPLVLAVSVDGGRRRPYGIVIGFVLAFSLLAIVARNIVAMFGIDLDLMRNVSLILLTIFGLVLFSSRLSEAFGKLTQGAASFGSGMALSAGGGLRNGILTGLLIGVVWTPCAGPILAAALVQVIRQQSDLAGYFVIVSFSLGAALPMLIIALMGKKIMSKLGLLARHAQAMRRIFGALILLSVSLIAYGVDAQSLFSASPRDASELSRSEYGLQNALNKPFVAPPFAGIEAWFNSEPLTMQNLKGRVVLVDFWTYSCINCIRTLPFITDLDRKYRGLGLVIVGVHSSEFEFEKKHDNVKAAIVQHGIHYPVALDNQLDTWRNFDINYWPSLYLIDRDGRVVYIHAGEGAYDEIENNIRYLLDLSGKVVTTRADGAKFLIEKQDEMSVADKNRLASKAQTIQLTRKLLASQKVVHSFKDCINCPEMVAIPAGYFEMGADNGEESENPVHHVNISKAFAIGRTEITQGQWRAVMGKNPSWFKKCGDNCPVEQVRWSETQEFIQKLNARTGKQYRLPSEAEWEYACRAGETAEYCGGDKVDSVAWSHKNSDLSTHPVARKAANGFGLYDMSGNVWEWVEDKWHDNYNGAPLDGSAWLGEGSKHVLRGGSWIGENQIERAAGRDWNELTARTGTGGFRIARTLP